MKIKISDVKKAVRLHLLLTNPKIVQKFGKKYDES